MPSRSPRALAGALTALAGLGVAQLVSRLVSTKDGPVEAIGTWIIRHPPGHLTERAIKAVGHADKPLLVIGTVVVVTAVLAVLATRRALGWFVAGAVVLAALGAAAILAQPGDVGARLVPIAAGLVTWLVLLPALLDPISQRHELGLGGEAGARPVPTGVGAAGAVGAAGVDAEEPATSPLRIDGPEAWLAEQDRRRFLTRIGLVAGLAAVTGVASRYVGGGRRAVEQARAALRLPGVTSPGAPRGADFGIAGQPRWQSPASDFYRIDTALLVPAVRPDTWRLRIHGMVDHPIELTLDDLLARELTEDWLTLCCVSNEVGGDLIGNAWWSGVRIAPLLAEAGVHPDADGVLQTSSDGWTCLTPVEALTDDRNALLAVAMNGEPLPVEHGFPVRMVVPGLYGYVSATKWLVDLEVTRFDRARGYWTDLGWSERGPIKLASRIDTPGDGATAKPDPSGRTVIAGSAWHQHTGIAGVEVSVDGGEWTAAELAVEPSVDTWVQWRLAVDLASGPHNARVRATGADGERQTSVVADPVPDGATGWHKVAFEVA